MIELLYFLTGCFENVLLVYFLDIYLQIKNTYMKYIFIVILIMEQQLIDTFNNPFLFLVPLGSFILYTIFNYHGTPLKKFYYPLFIFVSFLLTNLVVLLTYSYIDSGTYINSLENFNDRLIVAIFSKMIFFFVYLIFKRSKINRELNLEKEGFIFCFASLLTLISLIIVLLLINVENILSKKSFTYVLLFILIMYGFFYYFYLNSESRNKELIVKNMHLDMLENNIRFVNELQQIYEQNRRLNHDMKNHLVTIKGNIENNKKEEALAYIDNLYDRIVSIPMVNTSNEVFNYIVNSKVSIMQEAFIEFYYNIADSLQFMNAVDISSVLGNLLDNAIEAQRYVTGKKYIYLITIRKGNMVFLEVKNSCDKESINMSQGTLLTRKKDHFNHGLGIENVRSHLHKYNGDLEVIIEEDVFIVKVMMLL